LHLFEKEKAAGSSAKEKGNAHLIRKSRAGEDCWKKNQRLKTQLGEKRKTEAGQSGLLRCVFGGIGERRKGQRLMDAKKKKK